MIVWAACIQCSPLNRNKVEHLPPRLLLHLLQILQLHPHSPQTSQNLQTTRFPPTVRIPPSHPLQVEYQRPLQNKKPRRAIKSIAAKDQKVIMLSGPKNLIIQLQSVQHLKTMFQYKMLYPVEKKNEVQGKCKEQGQKSQIVEVPGEVVLVKRD